MAKSSTVMIEGVGPVLFESSRRAKHLNISVRPERGVRVAVPRGVTFRYAEKIVLSKIAWIQKHLLRLKSLEKERRNERDFPEVDREHARAVLTGRLELLANRHGFKYNRVFIRNQKTRWGSCSSKNNINLNMNLVNLPDELIDYVLLHELVHLKIKNHGKTFWSALDTYVGDSGKLRKRLRDFRIGQSVPG